MDFRERVNESGSTGTMFWKDLYKLQASAPAEQWMVTNPECFDAE